MSSTSDSNAGVSCLLIIFGSVTVLPLWYAIMIGILLHIEAPNWIWIAFWVYAPFSFGVSLMLKMVEWLNKE